MEQIEIKKVALSKTLLTAVVNKIKEMEENENSARSAVINIEGVKEGTFFITADENEKGGSILLETIISEKSGKKYYIYHNLE